MRRKVIFENCAGSVASCIAAERGGAGRIELCAALTEGGTTPSYGTVKIAKQMVAIPIFPIIRPRSGDFLYREVELLTMEEEIRSLVDLGADGFATGVLNEEGELDMEANRRLIEAAQGRPVTLHRAIDRTKYLLKAVDDAIALGFARILTSGGMPTAIEGAHMIAEMVRHADGRIIIMAGSGVRPDNAKWLIEKTGVSELHGTLQSTTTSLMKYKQANIGGDTVTVSEFDHHTTDEDKIRRLIESL
ncbi:MAG: copper homeostasis protein CutC [Porphyromonas sp.]|nr:copper homeostasis protein CutC [Porphyromonas sp.]